MRHFSPLIERPLMGSGVLAGTSRLAMAGLARPADTIFLLTRTFGARAEPAAPPSIFERACRSMIKTAMRAWSELNDNAHVDRRAPPGRNPGGRGQGKPD